MRYYTILTKEEKESKLVDLLESKVGEEQTAIIIESIGYSKLENLNELTVEDCSLSTRELEDGTFCCAVNLANAKYIKEKCAIKGMTDEQYQLAVLLYSEESLLTIEQMNKLTFKTTK